MPVVYLIGSLRNPAIPEIANKIAQDTGFEVFADWHCAGKIADDSWQEHETARGKTYLEALDGYAANHVFEFDMYHLNRADIAILVLPGGPSSHLELGYMVGRGKPTYILLDKIPERWDVMRKFANGVFLDIEKLTERLRSDSPAIAGVRPTSPDYTLRPLQPPLEVPYFYSQGLLTAP